MVDGTYACPFKLFHDVHPYHQRQSESCVQLLLVSQCLDRPIVTTHLDQIETG